MICHPRPIQLASILPPPSGHRECYMRITVTMPGAEAHIIVRSQDEIHVMIDFPHITLANSDDRLCRDSTLRSESRTKLRVESQRLQLQSRITIESQFQIGDRTYTATEPRWQSTINMMEKSSTEQRFSKEADSRVRPVKSYRQVVVYSYVLPTSQKSTWRQSTETRTEKST